MRFAFRSSGLLRVLGSVVLAASLVLAGCAHGDSGIAVTFSVGPTDATTIVVYDTASGQQREYPLLEGSNTVTVSADSTSVIGFISDPGASANGSGARGTGRSLGSAVALVGAIGVVGQEIDSLPMAEGAGTDVDLGTLART